MKRTHNDCGQKGYHHRNPCSQKPCNRCKCIQDEEGNILCCCEGKPGPPGPPGKPGVEGPPGPAGPPGPEGKTGPAGPAGPEGKTGPAGPAGPEGKTGPAGPAGPEGKTGPAGPAGPEGKTGPAGPAGPEGKTGPAGPAGPEGKTGPAGPAGPEGKTGPAGPAGPEGKTGPAGPAGPEGKTGPAGDCCCKNAVRRALQTIQKNQLGSVTLNYLNMSESGTINGTISDTDNVVRLNVSTSGGYIETFSLCNIISISFEKSPTYPISEGYLPYNCDNTSDCCCNGQIEETLRSYLPATPTFPVTINNIYIRLIDNNNKSYNTAKVYGICNGILWAELGDNSLGSKQVAIPLCSIFSIYKK